MPSPEDPAKEKQQPQRDRTDKSLRSERDKADAGIWEKREEIEEEADEVVRRARERADKILQTARDDADRELEAAQASAQLQRTRQDSARGRERATADALLELERDARRRYLDDFFEIEREATDQDLLGERRLADKLIAARDDFLANASHDLRSILGGLAVYSDLLLSCAPEGMAGENIRKCASANWRLVAQMNRLVNDLIDVAAIHAGQLAVVPDQVEVAKLLRETVEAFGQAAAAKGVTLDTELPEVPLHANLDEGRILQVLANLVSNAIKFTPANGKVSIRLRPSANEIHFSISDTGIGISKDELPGVFERFRQVRKDRRGLGIGLHIAKGIVEAHGGRMWAESELAAGSTFHFALPVESISRTQGLPPGLSPPTNDQ
jgi:signal transduction histidine kinase